MSTDYSFRPLRRRDKTVYWLMWLASGAFIDRRWLEVWRDYMRTTAR
jgi:hypothetical protein